MFCHERLCFTCDNVNYSTSEWGNTFLQTPQTQLWLTREMTDLWTFLHRNGKEWCFSLTGHSPLSFASTHTCLANWKQVDSQTSIGKSDRWGQRGGNHLPKNTKMSLSVSSFGHSVYLLVFFLDMLVIFVHCRCLFFFKSSQPRTFPEGWFWQRVLLKRTANTERLKSWFQVRVQAAQTLTATY